MKGKIKTKLAFIFFIIFCSASFAQMSPKFRVVLDAGHGGKDYGAIYHGFIEKKIALSVALKVGKLLEKDPDIQLVYTRKTDVFIELNERARIANDAKASIFVSIHCNGAVNQSAYGTETFVMGITRNASALEVAKKENDVVTMEEDYKIKYKGYDPNSPESLIGLTIMMEEYLDQSIDLASKIEGNFTNNLKRKSRGVKAAGFLVLRDIYMPRVLVELGFLSHKPEGEFLNSEAGQDKLAQAVADAILAYKKEFPNTTPPDNHQVVVPKGDKPAVKDVKTQAEIIPKADPVVRNEADVDAKGVAFKVQIAASSKNLDLVPSNFNGLDNISKIAESALIKYYYGATADYNLAKQLLEEAKAKGYPTAFIVAFKNGSKISVQEALNYTKR